MRIINQISEAKAGYNGNRVLYSHVHHWAGEGHSSAVIINYVVTGTEDYFLNKTRQEVCSGEYLLINKAQSFGVSIESAESPVKGFAVYLNEGLLEDVARNNCSKDIQLLDHPFDASKQNFEFLEFSYSNDNLQRYLQVLEKRFDREHSLSEVPADWIYFSAAQELLVAQGLVSRSVSNINASRSATRKELYKRVRLAKQILDDSSDHVNISDVASLSALSEFHFYRTFKQAFGITPNQYQVERKLAKAMVLLKEESLSVGAIALSSGFSDIAVFSKAFKAARRLTPLQYRRKFSRI